MSAIGYNIKTKQFVKPKQPIPNKVVQTLITLVFEAMEYHKPDYGYSHGLCVCMDYAIAKLSTLCKIEHSTKEAAKELRLLKAAILKVFVEPYRTTSKGDTYWFKKSIEGDVLRKQCLVTLQALTAYRNVRVEERWDEEGRFYNYDYTTTTQDPDPEIWPEEWRQEHPDFKAPRG